MRLLKTGPLTLLMIVSFLAACGQDPVIVGRVQDNFGRPIAGATVEISGSSFMAMTDGDGAFSVDYVPGAFTLTISAEGHGSRSVKLDIREPAKYPLDDTTLVKIPPPGGLFLVGQNGYIELVRSNIIRMKESRGFAASRLHYEVGSTGDAWAAAMAVLSDELAESSARPSGAEVIEVADTTEKPMKLYELDGAKLGSINVGGFGGASSLKEVSEAAENLGEQFVLRKVSFSVDDLRAGKIICYVEVAKNMMGQRLIPEGGATYCLSGHPQAARALRQLPVEEMSELLAEEPIVPGLGMAGVEIGQPDAAIRVVLGIPNGIDEYVRPTGDGKYRLHSIGYDFGTYNLYVYSDPETRIIDRIRLTGDFFVSADVWRDLSWALPKLKNRVTLGSSESEILEVLGEPEYREGKIGTCGKEGVADSTLGYAGISFRECGGVIEIDIR